MPSSLNLDNGGQLFNICLETNGDLSFKADRTDCNGNTRVTIQDLSGNVGIGIENPAQRLHIVGGRVRLENGSRQLDMRADGSQVDLQTTTNDLYIRSTGTGNHVVINPFSNDGNVGIGGPQTPSATLQVRGEVGLENSSGGELWNISVDSMGNLAFNANNVVGGNTRMLINDDTGDVSIDGTLSQGSSMALTDNITNLSAKEALEVLGNLNPVKFIYKHDNGQKIHTGFIAENSPEMVKSVDGRSICVTDVIAILTKIIKDQQESINSLAKELRDLNLSRV